MDKAISKDREKKGRFITDPKQSSKSTVQNNRPHQFDAVCYETGFAHQIPRLRSKMPRRSSRGFVSRRLVSPRTVTVPSPRGRMRRQPRPAMTVGRAKDRWWVYRRTDRLHNRRINRWMNRWPNWTAVRTRRRRQPPVRGVTTTNRSMPEGGRSDVIGDSLKWVARLCSA